MVRKLRIAVSALSLMACVLLIALSVRSYYVPFWLIRPNAAQTEEIGIASNRGRLIVGRFGVDAMLAADPQFALLTQQLMMEQSRLLQVSSTTRGGRWRQTVTQQRKIAGIQQQIAQYRTQFANAIILQGPSAAVVVPYWFLLLLAAAFTAAPWIKWRFSLRTLLIAITLVAVMLGLVVYAVK